MDEGGAIDTVLFNQLRPPIPDGHVPCYADLLERLSEAVSRGDLPAVGRVATASAQMYQAFNPKRHLDTMIRVAARVGACGTVVGHSGTCVGVILARVEPSYHRKLAATLGALAPLHLPIIVCQGRV